MNILGLNVFHADTSACLIKNGKLIAATEEERFTRIKHFSGFPKNSIDFCIKEGNLQLSDIDYISVNYNKYYNLKEKINFSISNIFSSNIFGRSILSYKKNNLNEMFIKTFGLSFEKKIIYVPHHLAHILSTFYYYDIEDGIGISIDGSGDFSTTEIYDLRENISLIEKVNYPHSLGIFYQSMTQFLGFKNYGDEYKVMGLASYGDPIYKERLYKVINSNKNFFELNLNYFDHHKTVIDYDFETGTPFFEDLFSLKLEKLFGKSRKLNEPISQFHKDLAASVQAVFEEIILDKINNIYEKYKKKNLCLSGGCIFNSSLNGKILNNSKFENIYFSPNVGDAGGAIGSALYVAKKYNENININLNPYLGTKYDDEYVKKNIVEIIRENNAYQATYFENFDDLCEIVTNYLKNSSVVGWFQDRMEWGPRALGNRSILGDPRVKNMREIINLKIKKREEFRPFAPSVLEEEAKNYFYIDKPSEYMTAVFKVKENVEDLIPAVVHVDKSSRVQTVSKKSNQKYFRLIKKFGEKTGIPILLNTSLNVNEPICESPENAIEIFTKTSMDAIVIQNWLFKKK